MKAKLFNRRKFSDTLFVLWAGGAALLSYSLIYALRKPYTAATFEDIDFFGIDYKIAVTTIQILGYLIAKLVGIKLISELKREDRMKFFVGSVIFAQLSLVAFGLIDAPYNAFAMFFNGLSLGCMWGVIFSFIEGRRMTDILASLLGVSIVISSGTAKSIGLYVMNDLGVDPFWMPALIGAFAFPLLMLMGYVLQKLPNPSRKDIAYKSERVAIDSKRRKEIFKSYMPILSLILLANFMIIILRDIKEDFLINILDVSGESSWLFAQVDSVVTIVILIIFALTMYIKKNIKALVFLLALVSCGTIYMSYISFNYETLNMTPTVWLFAQSLPLYIAFLTFQTIFFDRFIACFKIKGNVGYFIALIDFVGYAGTVLVLFLKELFHVEVDWFVLYNNMSAYVGAICSLVFILATVVLIVKYKNPNFSFSKFFKIKIRKRKQQEISVSVVN